MRTPTIATTTPWHRGPDHRLPAERNGQTALSTGHVTTVLDTRIIANTRLGLAVLGGFDVPITGPTIERCEFTVSVNAKYLFASNSGAGTFSLNRALMYWF